MMKDHKKYDLVVVGAGSGLDVAVAAAQNYDWKVALLEKGPLGGTCLNRGCIPSKIVIHAADVAEHIREAEKFGIKAKIESIDFSKVTSRANDHVDHEAEMIEKNVLTHPNIDLIKGEATFKDSHTLVSGKQEVSGKRILIAAGGRPFVPPIPGIEDVHYWTSTEALRQTKLPKSLTIIGGGYISAELGHFYGSLGSKVTILQQGDRLINREDKDISKTFTEVFSKKHEVLLNTNIVKVYEKDWGDKVVVVTGEDGKEKEIVSEALFVATGVRPNTDLIKAEESGIELTERGHIVVDETMKTTQDHIWALGDIVGKAPFKHGANYEAQHVFWNMKDGSKPKTVDYTLMPHAIFTSPQVAGIGLTEDQALEQDLSFDIRRRDYAKTGMGKALEENDGFIKFIVDSKKNKILGCHIIGPEAPTLIHEVAVVMNVADGDVAAIKNTVHIHPALNELVQRAL